MVSAGVDCGGDVCGEVSTSDGCGVLAAPHKSPVKKIASEPFPWILWKSPLHWQLLYKSRFRPIPGPPTCICTSLKKFGYFEFFLTIISSGLYSNCMSPNWMTS